MIDRQEVRSLGEWLDLYEVKLVRAGGFRPHPDQEYDPLTNPDPDINSTLTREEFEIGLSGCEVDYDCEPGFTVSALSVRNGREFGLPFHNYYSDLFTSRAAEDVARRAIEDQYGPQGIGLLVAGVLMGDVQPLDLNKPWSEGRGIFTAVGFLADTLERDCSCTVADTPQEAVQTFVDNYREMGREFILTGVFAGKREIRDYDSKYADDPDDQSERHPRPNDYQLHDRHPQSSGTVTVVEEVVEEVVYGPPVLGLDPFGRPYYDMLGPDIFVLDYLDGDLARPITGYGLLGEPLGPYGQPYYEFY